jgi:lysophospholipase L1-like esterase
VARICVFGDSITWGSWDPVDGGWVGRLRRRGFATQWNGDFLAVYNCGVGGDKLADLLARFEAEAMARQPDAIVLAIGINDVAHDDYPGTPDDQLSAGFDRLVGLSKGVVGPNVALLSPTNVDEDRSEHDYRNPDIDRVRQIAGETAVQLRVPFVDVFGLMNAQDLEPDGLHPGPSGHEKLYEAVRPAIFGLPILREMQANA